MRPPAERFALAAPGPDPAVVDPIVAVAAQRQTASRPDLRHAGVQRWVDQRGSIRLAGFGYRVPIVLAGEPVEAVVADNLVQIYHHDVLVASHVQRHKPDTPASSGPCRSTARAASTGIVVTRMVDGSGQVSFAGTMYRPAWVGWKTSSRFGIVAGWRRCPVTARSSAPTPPATTRPKNTAPSPPPTEGPANPPEKTM